MIEAVRKNNSTFNVEMYDVYEDGKYLYSIPESEFEIEDGKIKIVDEVRQINNNDNYSMLMGANSPPMTIKSTGKYLVSGYKIDR
tara:strand:- start:4395 stop:4649 length:255 start_codon:yes stop_codon:yes gene_type:complete